MKAANRGTAVHHMCEDYLNNDFDEEKHKKKFLAYCLFKQLAKETLDNVDNIHAQECGLYSDKYKVAGRVDCIAEYNGKLSIIDFKTSLKNVVMSGMKTITYKHLHTQRCMKNAQVNQSTRLLF